MSRSASSVGSALSSSVLNIRPYGRAQRRSMSIGAYNYGDTTDDVLTIVDQLIVDANKSISDPSVAQSIQQLKAKLVVCDGNAKLRIIDRLRSKSCSPNVHYLPDTVGSYLCGCFQSDHAFGGLKSECTAQCASSPFSSDDPCNQRVLYWSKDEITGHITSKHVAGNSTECNVFIDPSLNVSSKQRQHFLSSSGCHSVKYFNALSNAEIKVNEDGSISPQSRIQACAQKPTTAASPTSNSTITRAFNQQAINNATLSGASATTTQSFSAGGSNVWITVGIIIFILIIFILAFAMWRWGSHMVC